MPSAGPLMSDADAVSYQERQRWNAVAGGWRTWWDLFSPAAQPVSDRLIELAGIGPGDIVLDIATGCGEPALSAAHRVGPAGRVVATDHAGEMMRFARERAAAAGIDNVTFHECAADLLSFPGTAFDAALCRWGLMFVPAPVATTGVIRGLLKDGGRFATSAWAPAAEVPMIGTGGALIKSVLPEPPQPEIGPFRFAEAGALESVLAAAGFKDVEGGSVTVRVTFGSVAEFIRYRKEISTQDAALKRHLPPHRVEEVWAEVAREAARLADRHGHVRLDNRALVAVGRR